MATLQVRVSRLECAFQQLIARMDKLPILDEMRAEIRSLEVRTIKWMNGTMVAQTSLTVAAAGNAVALVKPIS